MSEKYWLSRHFFSNFEMNNHHASHYGGGRSIPPPPRILRTTLLRISACQAPNVCRADPPPRGTRRSRHPQQRAAAHWHVDQGRQGKTKCRIFNVFQKLCHVLSIFRVYNIEPPVKKDVPPVHAAGSIIYGGDRSAIMAATPYLIFLYHNL